MPPRIRDDTVKKLAGRVAMPQRSTVTDTVRGWTAACARWLGVG